MTIQSTAPENMHSSTLNPAVKSFVPNNPLFSVGSNPLVAASSLFNLIGNFGNSSPQQGALQGASIGAYLGTTVFPGIGSAIGGIVGAIGGVVSGLFNRSGKHPEQVARDGMRNALAEHGIIDSNHCLTLANGKTYDIGIDGGNQLKNVDGSSRHAYEVDFSNPLAEQAIAWAQPIAAFLTGGNSKLKHDLTGYFVNAATCNASTETDVAQNILSFFSGLKAAPQEVLNGIGQMYNQSVLSEGEAMAYANGLISLFEYGANKQQNA